MNVMGVDFIAPVMMRSAWFWILSRDGWLVFAVVDHAVELYSRTGLTDPSYTVLSICSLAPHVVPASLRMIVSFLRAFPSVRRVCVFHFSLLSKVTPRYVVWSSSFRVCVPILMGLSCFFGDRVNSDVEDLSLLTMTHQSSVHAVRWSMACWIL